MTVQGGWTEHRLCGLAISLPGGIFLYLLLSIHLFLSILSFSDLSCCSVFLLFCGFVVNLG